MPILLVILVVLLLLTGLFFAVHLRRIPVLKKRSWWLTAVLTLTILFVLLRLIEGGVIVLIFAFFSCLLSDVLHLFLRRVHGWTWIYQTGLLAVILTVIASVYGYWNMSHVVVKRYTVSTDKIEEDTKLVMISDLHFGTTMGEEGLQKQCERIQAEQPDMILLVGDLFDESTSREQMEAACAMLGSLKTKLGTYYVYGNHEAYLRMRSRDFSMEEALGTLRANGIRTLTDETVEAGPFLLTGRKDRTNSRKSLDDLLDGTDPERFRILLDHQPVEMRRAASLGVDLMLSGHTHSGQIWPFGYFATLGSNEMLYGRKQIDAMTAIVSSGIGGWGFPVRTEGHSEIVVITLARLYER